LLKSFLTAAAGALHTTYKLEKASLQEHDGAKPSQFPVAEPATNTLTNTF